MQMIDYVLNIPVVDSLVYDSIGKLVHIGNYTDYFIAEMYYVNHDWPNNNIKYWRSFADPSRWRYIMTDTDPGLGLASQANANELQRILYSNILYVDNHKILRRLIENADYRRYFINRSADMFNTMLLPQNINCIIDIFKDRIAPEMPNHQMKWGGTLTYWENKIQLMKNFVLNRPGHVWQQYIQEFDLDKLVTLSLSVDSSNHGKIKINTIIPDSLPWQGTYFDGNPVEINAIPDSGFVFSHWKSNSIISGDDTLKQKLNINIDTNEVFKAFFSLDTFVVDTPQVVFSEINYYSSDTLDAGDWVELLNKNTTAIDLSGWVFKDDDDEHTFIIPETTILDIDEYLVLCRDTIKFTEIYADSVDFIGPFGFGLANEEDSLRLFDATGFLIVSMTYSNLPPWPTDADGTGKTLELHDPSGDLNDGSNWFTGCVGGSPGGPYVSCDTIHIRDNLVKNGSVIIYPNPTRSDFHLEIVAQHNDFVVLTLLDVLGNVKLKRNVHIISSSPNSFLLHADYLKPGIYLLKIEGNQINQNVKITKQ
jgi:hypothetical protein